MMLNAKMINKMLPTVVLVVFFSMPCLAGAWEQDAFGWRYKDNSGSYVTARWEWIDANNDGNQECFFFNNLGYMLANTITPDGYTVNENGEWVVNGIVQHQTSNVIISKPKDEISESNIRILGIDDSIESYEDLNVSGKTSQEASHNILSQLRIRCQTLANKLYNENLSDIKVSDWSISDRNEVLSDYDSYLNAFFDDYELQVDYVISNFNLPTGRKIKMMNDGISTALEVRSNLSEKLTKAINRYKGKD